MNDSQGNGAALCERRSDRFGLAGRRGARILDAGAVVSPEEERHKVGARMLREGEAVCVSGGSPRERYQGSFLGHLRQNALARARRFSRAGSAQASSVSKVQPLMGEDWAEQ